MRESVCVCVNVQIETCLYIEMNIPKTKLNPVFIKIPYLVLMINFSSMYRKVHHYDPLGSKRNRHNQNRS